MYKRHVLQEIHLRSAHLKHMSVPAGYITATDFKTAIKVLHAS